MNNQNLEHDYDTTHFWFEPVPCPECGEEKLMSCHRANGPADYIKETTCRSCGATWED